MKKNDLIKSIVEKSGHHLITGSSQMIEPKTATLLLQSQNTIEFVLGEKGGDRACIFKLFADRETVLPAYRRDAKTIKDEGLTVRIDVTLI